MNLNDKRVLRTRNILRQSMLDLMKRKPVSQVTVKEICDLAGINRNTFYAHYGMPEDILAEIENEYYVKMNRIQESAIKTGDVSALILGIMNTLFENKEYSMVLYGDHNDRKVRDGHYKNSYSRVMISWIESGTSAQADHLGWLFTFLSGGIDAVIRNWVKNGMKEDPAQIARLAARMCNASSSSVFDAAEKKN